LYPLTPDYAGLAGFENNIRAPIVYFFEQDVSEAHFRRNVFISLIDNLKGFNRPDLNNRGTISGFVYPIISANFYAVIHRYRIIRAASSATCWRLLGACAEHGKGDEATGTHEHHFPLHCLSLPRLELDPVFGAFIQNDRYASAP
jgi:hypothetical protein